MTVYVVVDGDNWSVRWSRHSPSTEFMTLERKTFDMIAMMAVVRTAVGWSSPLLVFTGDEPT